jgi:predicted ATPase/DNA-binding CsgD family transcriptional regulator
MDDDRQQLHEPLTDRELEILRLIADGLTNQQIADQLFVTLDTVKWHNRHSYQKLHVHNRTQAVARARELSLLDRVAEPRFFSREKSNLPTQTTPFIGREKELTDIQQLLLDEPDCRLLTLAGPGGIGKTRLALAAAARVTPSFLDGVYFAPLAAVDHAAFIVPAIADALHFTFYGNTEPTEQLLDYLEAKQLLLVVDNFEHLLDGADVLTSILNRAPDVRLLATSRERLRLKEEWIYEVQGLPYPPADSTETAPLSAPEIETYQAVQLFVQRARQADAGFTPTTQIMADVVRICQLVEGMPLGLELAAPWIRSLNCHEIVIEIGRSLDFLTTSLRNLPERHRSLRVVIEQTWQRLPPAEQSALRQLSVFRGGCTRKAAQTVTGATLVDLSSLIDKALLRRTNTGRYELHELIRQFGEEQLQADPEAIEAARQRHTDHFIRFLEQRTADVKGTRQVAAMVEIADDLDNVRLAWRRAVANQDADAIERAAACLFVFNLYNSGHYEGQTVFQQAVAAFTEDFDMAKDDGLPDELVVLNKHENLVGFLLACQGYFLGRTRDPYMGQALLEQALALLRRAEGVDRHKEGFVWLWLGWMVLFQERDRTEMIQAYVEPTSTILTETGDRWAEVWSLLLWGNILYDLRPLEAERVYARGAAICRESGDLNNLGYTSQNRSGVNVILGRYAQAKQHMDEAHRVFVEADNILGLAYVLLRQGQLETVLGEYRQAIQTFQQAMAIFDKVRTQHNVTWAQAELGRACRLNGDLDRAEYLFKHALEAFTARKRTLSRAHCLRGFGCLAVDQGELRRAETYLREALVTYQQFESEVWVADVLSHLGQVMMASGEQYSEAARQFFRQALELAAQHQLAPIALAVCVDMAKLWIQTDPIEKGTALLTLARQHEASTFETREKAHQALAQMTNPLSSDSPQFTQSKEQTADLWATVDELLGEDKQIMLEV